AGVKGMQQLFSALKSADSNQLSDTADSDKIVNSMSTASGLSHGAIAFPFKDSTSFEADVAGLTHPDYGTNGDDTVVDYIQHKIPSYMDGQGASVPSAIITTPAAIVAPTTVPTSTGCPVLTKTLSLGSKGDDISALQQYLAHIGLLASAPTGYFGKLTQKA